MLKNSKNYFQNIHYNRQKANFLLSVGLAIGEFFYKQVILIKNFLYEQNILKEQETNVNVICVGNLTTGGVGKTPIVIMLANKIAKNEKIAIISRGYGANLQNKTPNIIKDLNKIYFEDGKICGDEALQIAKKTSGNIVVITCKDRLKAIKLAKEKYDITTAILDDGFSNRTIKKDKTIMVIDSKMRFGNNHLLPFGPLREPIKEIKRADEIILVDKNDENINDAINWSKNKFDKQIKICKMYPKRIYNISTKAIITPNKIQNAIAFCAIGQPLQFFNFAKEFYNIAKEVSFNDHYIYTKKDIETLTSLAKKHNTNILVTTQKDEAKLKELVLNSNHFSFNILELDSQISEIN